MESRSEKRYKPSRVTEGSPGANYAFQFDIDERLIQGVITDISLKGIGGKIEAFSGDFYKRLKASNDLFIKILTGGDVILAGVKLVWLVKDHSHQNTLYGGFAFSILSPEDRVKLYSIIQKNRENSAF